MTKKHKSAKVLNHYSVWKYLVLITTLVILTLSAIPTWYGEQPSIQIAYAKDTTPQYDLLQLKKWLASQEITVDKITQQNGVTTLVFADENAQSLARKRLDGVLHDDATLTFSYLSIAPQWLSDLGFNPIKLGLDLRGGVQFLLNVDVDKAFEEQRDALADEIRAMLRSEKLRSVQIQASKTPELRVLSESVQAKDKVVSFIKTNYANWQTRTEAGALVIKPSEAYVSEFQSTTLKQNLKIMRDRIEELGITEALVQRQGAHSIRIELPGVQDPAQAKNVIGATASLAFYAVKAPGAVSSSEDLILSDNDGRQVILDKRPVLTGEHIVNARAGVDKMGMSEVNISLDHSGGKKMSDFSAKHLGKPMATVYREYITQENGEISRSERVISVATIQSQLGSQFRITGAGSMDEAQQLALLLRAGSLTAPVSIVEERTIGASLGAENIENGFAALALGMGLTLTFMALWYRRLGWVANVALVANMLCLLGLIALLPGAVLTLPGIAGLVLTVGMAVDTNVIIFERIKDKMREGRSFAQAIDAGFDSAFSTILDANITTMITAVVLYAIGNGPIQGFALTLGLGLLTSMFTGVFASRAMINLIWGRDSRRSVRV
ncbi:protein-export membrane protein SecD [Vibrio navarrensis]|uniref:protein translocase subunit SecD n=1 Tax=Vibrio navarrensis TaxID=29495 RepID=UPI00186AACE7|nr:protein translocase subunit SecD [Vibrio navarrensis]MBE3671041.1 protein-export membrane protein SecD [Vibrio navarrensis]MBE4591453.1 protein-export membrane protein SecD [Vibrio navarrensis]